MSNLVCGINNLACLPYIFATSKLAFLVDILVSLSVSSTLRKMFNKGSIDLRETGNVCSSDTL